VASLVQIAYTSMDSRIGDASLMPYAPVRLAHLDKNRDSVALVDSGASVNVLPFQIGCDLGLDWEKQTTRIRLSGNLANFDARAVLLTAHIANLSPVKLVFAWTQRDDVPLIFGQTNFFMTFDVCFHRSRGFFTLSLTNDG
jgi:hypothetical protein